MFQKGTRYYSDWRDRKGVRHRKPSSQPPKPSPTRRKCRRAFTQKRRTRAAIVAGALVQAGCDTAGQNTRAVADILRRVAGRLSISKLSPSHVALVNAWLGRYENPFSAHRRAGSARTLFRKLNADFGAPKLHHLVSRIVSPSPRNVTASPAERSKLLAAAKPHLRCWLLLCSDLAIRSGTAARLGPNDYRAEDGILEFRTKYQTTQRLPVTADLKAMLDTCVGDGPFVSQLRGKPQTAQNLGMQFMWLRRSCGITRKLTPHDLRRTTARAVYALTGDLRDAQTLLGHRSLDTTMWYLQDALITLAPSTLELELIS